MNALTPHGGRSFLKMQGLGNDFVIFDGRTEPLRLSDAEARAVADRHYGIGCDQVITLLPSARADCFMRIQNADGGEVGACGNVTRCAAKILMSESGASRATIETLAGVLKAEAAPGGLVSVDMGVPRFGWREIPLSREMDSNRLDLKATLPDGRALHEPSALSIGNPHAVFFVDDAESVDPASVGPALERDPLFPERANIGFAAIRADGAIRLKVWERGAGVTRACGTGAVAALIAACRRGLIGRRAPVILDGGVLEIAWGADDHAMMTGPAELSFTGEADIAVLVARRQP